MDRRGLCKDRREVDGINRRKCKNVIGVNGMNNRRGVLR